MDAATAPPTSSSSSSERASQALALTQACAALWLATLSLMATFMQTPAPAHRCLIARRIARNLQLLQAQDQVFTTDCRTTFAMLARRWSAKAQQLVPEAHSLASALAG